MPSGTSLWQWGQAYTITPSGGTCMQRGPAKSKYPGDRCRKTEVFTHTGFVELKDNVFDHELPLHPSILIIDGYVLVLLV